jgi:hypothetical protein
MKMSWPLVILIITILAAVAAYWSNIQSDRQLNRMENYDSLNLNLAKEIKSLSDLNNSIASRIDTIVIENHKLTAQNISLTTKANELITQVEKLAQISNTLISKVDVRTEKATLENALTGEFNFDFGEPLNDDEMLAVKAGEHGITVVYPVKWYRSDRPPKNIVIDGVDIIPFKILDGKL